MKWIGQHVYDQISRFRDDVYLEDLSTTTETNVLVVDSNGKVSKTTAITGDITGVALTAGTGVDLTSVSGATGGAYAATIGVDVSDFMTNGADNYVLTATGADAMNAEANLQFDGTDLTIASAGKVEFRDANSYMHSPTANDLEIVGTDIVLDAAGVTNIESEGLITMADGGVLVTTASDAGTALTITGYDVDQPALAIGPFQTTGDSISVSGGGLTTGHAVNIASVNCTSSEIYVSKVPTATTGSPGHDGMINLTSAKSVDTASGAQHVTRGIQSSISDTGTNVGISDLINLTLNTQMDNADGTTTTIGIVNSFRGALADTTIGYKSQLPDGGTDFILYSSADAGDSCSIATTTHGATTITTVDDDAAAAHFEIAADGNIILDAEGDVVLEPRASGSVGVNTTGNTTANALLIDCDSLTTGSAISLDIDDALTATAAKSLLAIDYDKAGVTASGQTSTTTGLDISLADAATNHASGAVTMIGATIDVDSANAQGTITQKGLKIGVAADGVGDVATTTGIEMRVADGGTDIKIASSADSGDYCTIATTTNGATTITTVDAGAAAANFEIAADGNITLDAAGDIALEAAGNDVTVDSDTFTITSSTADQPIIKLLNTTDDAQAGQLIFEKLRDDGGVASGTNLGEIWFKGEDSAGNTQNYAYIVGEIDVSTGGQESGQLVFGIANHDGGITTGLKLTGGSIDNEIDVTVGLGTSSVTTIAGDLTVTGSDLTFDSVALTAIQTSGESFADNDTSIMTSAAIDDKINTKYSTSYIPFSAKSTSSFGTNYVLVSANGISESTFSKDSGVDSAGDFSGVTTEQGGSGTDATISIATSDLEQQIVIPETCKLIGFYATGSALNTSGGDAAGYDVGVGIWHVPEGNVNWGATSNETATLIHKSDSSRHSENTSHGGGNRKKVQMIKRMDGTAKDLAEGDIIIPSIFGETADQQIIASITLVIATPIKTIA